MKITDMPKLESPFVREENDKGDYVVIPEITEGYEWVFEDEEVKSIEKLDGSNVSLLIKDGLVKGVWNRSHRVQLIPKNKNKQRLIKAILNSKARGYLEFLDDGQYFGEVVGPSIQGNHYELKEWYWIPFKTYSWNTLSYHSWGKYPKTFESISKWFKDDLFSIFYAKRHRLSFNDEKVIPAEGVVFTHPDGRMAKLRRDMFDWYKGKRH